MYINILSAAKMCFLYLVIVEILLIIHFRATNVPKGKKNCTFHTPKNKSLTPEIFVEHAETPSRI